MESNSAVYRILFSGGIMCLILLSLFGNIFVCLAVYQSINLRARVNYLIVSLAVADILIASISMPMWLTFELTNFSYLSHKDLANIQKIWRFVDMLCAVASIANLVAISLERLWSVCSPLKHRQYFTPRFTLFMIALVWLYASFFAVTGTTWRKWKWVVVYYALLGFVLPLLVIIASYLIIFRVVSKSRRNVVSSQDNRRINITIVVIVFLFSLCWAPYFVASLAIRYCHSCFFYMVNNLWLRSLIKCAQYSNSCVNPIVYGIANAQYKEAFRMVLRRLYFCCLNKSPSQSRAAHRVLREQNAQQKLCADISPDVDGASARTELYLPGDYRSLPNKNLDFVDCKKLKVALENPDSLQRTSYI